MIEYDAGRIAEQIRFLTQQAEKLDERQTALDQRQTTLAVESANQRGWNRVAVLLGTVSLVLIIPMFVLVLNLATLFRVVPW